ncbi:MAG: cytochrome d ubiquinol oxidase subunit II [Planctomycetia bacterium]|nr:cytochrome d ubiquinol oxidase subunit II [Planctomycetia bacterium]
MEPESLLLVVMHVSLTLYAMLGGADFGGGIWELNTAFQASDKERRLIYSAIGPVWEANHVWLIFVLVLSANAFPIAFAAACRALWLPLLLTLVGIVFRGSAFAFRSYTRGHQRQEAWDVIFALASTLAPFFLGVSVGAIASGQLSVAPDGSFYGDALTDWLSPLSIFTAFFAVGMCAYLAAFYLTREANQSADRELTTTWRTRSLATGIWMSVLSCVGLAFVAIEAPLLWSGFGARGWPLVIVALVAGAFSLVAMWRRRYTIAAVSAAVTVASVMWGWAVAQYPLLVPPTLTVHVAKAPDRVLTLVIIIVAGGFLLVVPSLGYLLYLFKSKPRP